MWIRLTSYGATSRMAPSLPLEQVGPFFGRGGLQEGGDDCWGWMGADRFWFSEV